MTDLAIPDNFNLAVGTTYIVKPLGDGIQILIRFPNDAGVSVIRHSGSYGSTSGLWEAAPILFVDDEWENWEFIGLAFNLPGFSGRDDVKGWLTAQEIDEIMTMVAAL